MWKKIVVFNSISEAEQYVNVDLNENDILIGTHHSVDRFLENYNLKTCIIPAYYSYEDVLNWEIQTTELVCKYLDYCDKEIWQAIANKFEIQLKNFFYLIHRYRGPIVCQGALKLRSAILKICDKNKIKEIVYYEGENQTVYEKSYQNSVLRSLCMEKKIHLKQLKQNPKKEFYLRDTLSRIFYKPNLVFEKFFQNKAINAANKHRDSIVVFESLYHIKELLSEIVKKYKVVKWANFWISSS